MTLLESRLEEVNVMALAGDLPDVDISDKGIKITPLENSVPSGVSPLLIWFMACFPILKLRRYWKKWTAGRGLRVTSCTSKIITSDQRRKTVANHHSGRRHQSGTNKMAESCPGATRSSLDGIQAWYIRDETYSAALAELVNAQKRDLWLHSGATGQHRRQTDRTFG